MHRQIEMEDRFELGHSKSVNHDHVQSANALPITKYYRSKWGAWNVDVVCNACRGKKHEMKRLLPTPFFKIADYSVRSVSTDIFNREASHGPFGW